MKQLNEYAETVWPIERFVLSARLCYLSSQPECLGFTDLNGLAIQ